MNKKLYRSSTDNIIGGVCGGLGEYFNIDSNLLRIIFILFGVFGAGVVVYLILWIIFPIKEDGDKQEDLKDEKVNDMKKDNDDTYKMQETRDRNISFLAFVFIFFGLFLLINNLFLSINIHKLWPLIIIIIGFSMIANNRK